MEESCSVLTASQLLFISLSQYLQLRTDCPIAAQHFNHCCRAGNLPLHVWELLLQRDALSFSVLVFDISGFSFSPRCSLTRRQTIMSVIESHRHRQEITPSSDSCYMD